MIGKNLNVRQLALILAILLGAWVLILGVFLDVLPALDLSIWPWIAAAVGGSVLMYFVSRFLLDYFIYRRIKLIYKYIHDVKTDPDSRKVGQLASADMLESVESEVRAWAEKQQQELDTLRALETYRRNFLGNISHELKTPIFNIQGYLHTLLEGGLRDESINVKYLDRAARNVDRLETIVTDLETIAQLEADQMVLEMEPFDLRQLVREVFEDHERLAAERKIKLRLKPGADQEFQVFADRDRIRQVLNNLVTNAIKYGKGEGYTMVGMYDMDDKVLIEVSDDGVGIAENHLKHVFDRFYRVDVSRSRELGGSGLGLSIVKHIMEAHKQGVTVRSSMGRGSTFGFTLAKAA